MLRLGSIFLRDAIATTGGVYVTLLCLNGTISQEVTRDAWTAAPLLVLIRAATAMVARFQQWSSGNAVRLNAARLAISMLAASVMFASACRTLPASVYALEFFITTTFMAGLQSATRFEQGQCSAASLARLEGPRRALNVVVALTGIVLTFPIWILVAIAIKATSRGPVIYKQERIGLDLRSTAPLIIDPRRKRDLGGKPFLMYKFRTMAVDAERTTGAVWCAQSDPRVTRIGRLLRHCRLDELPQLINVLKGDMNIVGPRPERPTIFAELRIKIPNYQARQRVRPGITGHAQVNLEYDSSLDDVVEKVRYDLEYLSRQSVMADLYIMAKTVPVMLFRERMLATRVRRADGAQLSTGKGGI